MALRTAPYGFYEALLSDGDAGSTFVITIASLPNLEVPAERITELRRELPNTPRAASKFLSFLVFEHIHRDKVTVECVERLAINAHNQTLKQKFASIKALRGKQKQVAYLLISSPD